MDAFCPSALGLKIELIVRPSQVFGPGAADAKLQKAFVMFNKACKGARVRPLGLWSTCDLLQCTELWMMCSTCETCSAEETEGSSSQ